jgi:hypothetical protein
MDKVFVVVGTTGSYSDRQEWCARAFPTEAEATAFATMLNTTWKSELEIARHLVKAPIDGGGYEAFRQQLAICETAGKRIMELDPACCGCDYPSWAVAEVAWGSP